MRFIFSALCFCVCLGFVESLLDQDPVGNGPTDPLVLELQRNFRTFKREMELQLSLMGKNYTNEILVQNQTITAQRQKILELEQQQKISAAIIMEQNRTIANQGQKIAQQELRIIEQDKRTSQLNSTFNRKCLEDQNDIVCCTIMYMNY